MNPSNDILLSIINGEHISIEKRKSLAIGTNPVLKMDDFVSVLADELQKVDCYPPSQSCGGFLREGIVITKREGLFVCVSQRTSPSDPREICEKNETVFRNARDAARFYLKWELCLPGRIDGFVVES